MRSCRPSPIAVLLFLAGTFLFPAASLHSASPEDHPAVPQILSRAEFLFQSMKARNYPAIFATLSAKSRETIVAETASAIAAQTKRTAPREPGAAVPTPGPAKGPDPDIDAIRDDFLEGGAIARAYWDAYLRRFDPDAALEHCRWEIGSVGKERAEILLTHQGAEHPAVLEMFLEGGGWKVGLVETFWPR